MGKLVHIETKPEEVEYIEKYFGGSPTKYWRDSIKNELKKIKHNKKKSTFQQYTQSFIMLGLGAIFVLFSTSTSNLIAFLLIFLLGVFFVVNGLSTIGWGMFKKWKKS